MSHRDRRILRHIQPEEDKDTATQIAASINSNRKDPLSFTTARREPHSAHIYSQAVNHKAFITDTNVKNVSRGTKKPTDGLSRDNIHMHSLCFYPLKHYVHVRRRQTKSQTLCFYC